MNQCALHFNKVNKFFAKQQVLCNLDWKIDYGKVIGLLGRNGAGKSTLLECALGLRKINSGMIKIFNESTEDLSDETRSRIGYVPQISELFEWLTVKQMLAHFKVFYPRWNDQKINALLRNWSIDENKKITYLSIGQKQKLSIIRALAHEPDLLILDEPVASLDPFARREFLKELINNVISYGTTVIFSTHILSDIERIAIDISFLKDGFIALEGRLDQLLESIFRIEGEREKIERLRLLDSPHSIISSLSSNYVILKIKPDDIEVLRTKNPELKIENMNLEDLFIEATR